MKPMDKPELASANTRRWTRIDSYIEGLARREATRRERWRLSARSEPEAPRLMLSTIPFVATMAVFVVLIVCFAVAAWPGSQPQVREQVQPREMGTAQRGWFEEAQKQFR